MSVTVKKVHDPRIEIKPDRTYIAPVGGTNVTVRPYAADTASDSQIIWSQTVPSVNVGVSRRVMVECSFLISCLKEDNVTAAPLKASFGGILEAGLRQFPIHSVSEVCSVRLNDQSIDWQPSQIVHGMLKYGNTEFERQTFMGMSPHYPDVTTTYGLDSRNAGSRNPFSDYFNGGYEDSRSFEYWLEQVDANTARLTVAEPLMLAPFYYGEDEHQALFGIQNFDLTLTLSNLKRVLSGTAAALVGVEGSLFPTGVIGNLSVVVDTDRSNQKLHLTYITPQPDEKPPSVVHYPYYEVRRFTQDVSTIAPQAQFNVVINNITLNAVPKRAYYFAHPVPSNDPTVADHFAAPVSARISFDNKDSLLANMAQRDLYQMAVKNGYTRSWLEWKAILGGVLCTEFGEDISLAPNLSSGVRGNFSFQPELTFQDVRAAGAGNINYRCYVVVISEGVLSVADQQVSVSVGPLSQEDMKHATWDAYVASSKDIYGGSFKSIVGAVRQALKYAAPVIKAVAPVFGKHQQKAEVAGDIAGLLGKGLSGGKRVRSSSLARRVR